jgi:hypothetical protein
MAGQRGDFREMFDLRRLDERQLGQIEFVLNSPAYDDSFKPYMLSIIASMNAMWKDRSRERQDRYPDEFLAGGVCFGEGLLKFFSLLIHETSMERIHEAMLQSMTNDQLYDARRNAGGVKPVVGINQPATPNEGEADPEEY